MAIIHAGAKDFPITLQKKVETRTDNGGIKTTWEDKYEVMASRKDLRGDESYVAAQMVATGKTSWRIWYRKEINAAGWRVRDDYSGVVYDIHYVSIIGRRQELELMTERKDND